MPKQDDALLLYRIAKNYYINNMTQDAIARQEHISRPQISRMLSKAKDAGIVDIRIHLPEIVDRAHLEDKLRKQLDLQQVIISPSGSDADDSNAMLYTIASDYLASALSDYHHVGIGWGQTVYRTSLQMQLQERPEDLTFYPIVGNSGMDNLYLQTDSICARYAEKFQTRSVFSSSLILSPRESLTKLEERRHAALCSCWDRLDAIVLSVGGHRNPDDRFLEEIPADLFEKKLFTDIIGDLVGHFFFTDHSDFMPPEEYEMVVIGLEQLKQTPNIICIANGESKVDMIRFAANAGYIKTLITDSDTALAILE